LQPLRARILSAPRIYDAGSAARVLDEIAAPPAEARELIAGVAGCSPFLSAIMRRAPELVASLLDEPPESSAARLCAAALVAADTADPKEQARLLRLAKREAALAHALAEISGAWSTMEAAHSWSLFADHCVNSALRMALRQTTRFGFSAVDEAAPERASGVVALAMGKHGAFELNYSSDIDLVVLYDSASPALSGGDDAKRIAVAAAKAMVARLNDQTADGYVFRTDLRLRPDPGVSPAALSVAAAEAYYEGYGQNWERAAYIKARAAAGDIRVGEAFIAALRPFIWRKYLDFSAIDDIHAILRQVAAGKGEIDGDLNGFDLKRGPGGIRAIEFFAQTNQLIAGGKNPDLRHRSTLDALAALTRSGALSEDARETLGAAYLSHRRIEHRIQMIADEQTHRLPLNRDDWDRLGAFAGFEDAAALRDSVRRNLRAALTETTRLYRVDATDVASPLNFAGVDAEAATLAELARLGFKEPGAVIATVRRWVAGEFRATRTPRARALLAKMTPALIEAFARAGDPDAAVRAFQSFLETLPAGVQIFALLANRPDVFDNLISIVTISPHLAREIARRPHLTEAMIESRWPAPAVAAEDLRQEARDRAATESDFELAINAVRRWGHEENFAVSAQLVLGLIAPPDAALRFTHIAEAAISACLSEAERQTAQKFGAAPGALAIVALGRLGAAEMTAASDIDVMYVYDAPGSADAPAYYGRLVRRAVAAIASPSEEGALYDVDMQLRPSGSKGPVAVSFAAFEHYYRAEAWTWEKMALVKARAIAGSTELCARIDAEIAAILEQSRDPLKTLRDVDDMRERLYSSRPARSAYDLKLARGGLIDIDFILQSAVLCAPADAAPPRSFAPQRLIAALEKAGRLTAQEGLVLSEAYRVFEGVNQLARAAAGGLFAPSAAGAPLIALMARMAGASTLEEFDARLAALRANVDALFDSRIRSKAREAGA
jgi:glutamate-ammonia-ligase adenylyltransferase